MTGGGDERIGASASSDCVGLHGAGTFKGRQRVMRVTMNVDNIDGLMRAMELEGNARIDIIRIGKNIQTAGYSRRLPSVQQYEELRRAVVHWQRIADDIGRIVGGR
ncbi:MAG TPA: hypothetical protein VFZ03_09505 [Dongiaceae bacterium]